MAARKSDSRHESGVGSFNYSIQEKTAPTDIHWHLLNFTETKQLMWAYSLLVAMHFCQWWRSLQFGCQPVFFSFFFYVLSAYYETYFLPHHYFQLLTLLFSFVYSRHNSDPLNNSQQICSFIHRKITAQPLRAITVSSKSVTNLPSLATSNNPQSLTSNTYPFGEQWNWTLKS